VTTELCELKVKKVVLLTVWCHFRAKLWDWQWQKFGWYTWREDNIKMYPHHYIWGFELRSLYN